MKKVYGVRSASWEPIAMVCESHDDTIEFACAMKGVNPENAANIIDSDNIVPLLFIESDPVGRIVKEVYKDISMGKVHNMPEIMLTDMGKEGTE